MSVWSVRLSSHMISQLSVSQTKYVQTLWVKDYGRFLPDELQGCINVLAEWGNAAHSLTNVLTL